MYIEFKLLIVNFKDTSLNHDHACVIIITTRGTVFWCTMVANIHSTRGLHPNLPKQNLFPFNYKKKTAVSLVYYIFRCNIHVETDAAGFFYFFLANVSNFTSCRQIEVVIWPLLVTSNVLNSVPRFAQNEHAVYDLGSVRHCVIKAVTSPQTLPPCCNITLYDDQASVFLLGTTKRAQANDTCNRSSVEISQTQIDLNWPDVHFQSFSSTCCNTTCFS